MALLDYQYSIDGYVFGEGTNLIVDNITGLGLGPKRSKFFANPGADGVTFGREYRDGKTITIEGHTKHGLTAAAALDAIEALEAKWDGIGAVATNRRQPRTTKELKIKWPGRVDRTILGRPNRFDYDPQMLAQGRILWSATFEAATA